MNSPSPSGARYRNAPVGRVLQMMLIMKFINEQVNIRMLFNEVFTNKYANREPCFCFR